MLITNTKFSVAVGEFIDIEQTLVQDYETVYNPGHWEVLKNSNKQNILRFAVKNNAFTYQIYNGDQVSWEEELTLPTGQIISDGQLGQPNGIATLDTNGKLRIEETRTSLYKGTEAEMMTPGFYEFPPPIGTLFATSDTQELLVLLETNFTVLASWIAIAETESQDVLSVNGKVGNVILNAEDIPVTTDVDFQDNQLKNIQRASVNTDAVRFDQLTEHYFYYGYCNANMTPLVSIYTMVFDRDIEPINPIVLNTIEYNNGIFSIGAGIYQVSLKVGIKYKDSTETPGFVSLLMNGEELVYTISELDSPQSFDIYKENNFTFIVKSLTPFTLSVQLNIPLAAFDSIEEGSSVFIEALEIL